MGRPPVILALVLALSSAAASRALPRRAAPLRLRGGADASIEAANAAEHAAECAKCADEAWCGEATPPEDAGLPEFDALEVDASYTCADFDRELRRSDGAPHAIYVAREPLFSRAECAELIAAAEAHVEGAWGTIGAGRHAIFGGWVKDVPPAREWLDARLRAKIYPALCRLYPRLVAGSSSAALRVQSAYLFKYDAASRAATDVHVDSALLSFTIALNAPEDYDGGGTWCASARDRAPRERRARAPLVPSRASARPCSLARERAGGWGGGRTRCRGSAPSRGARRARFRFRARALAGTRTATRRSRCRRAASRSARAASATAGSASRAAAAT